MKRLYFQQKVCIKTTAVGMPMYFKVCQKKLKKKNRWMHETGAQGWCTGKTQRDWVEREVGRGIGMGNTCNSMANSCQCMTKTLQYCKVTSLQLLKTNEKKKKRKTMWAGDYHADAFVYCYQQLVVDVLSTGCCILSETAIRCNGISQMCSWWGLHDV